MDANSHPTRRRHAGETHETILQAARTLFTAHGFDETGTRDIAGLAGVNIALINRYFASKEGLFKAAILAELRLDPGLLTDPKRLAANLAAMVAGKTGPVAFDPVMAILRSASSPVVGPQIREAVAAQAIVPLAATLGDAEGARQKATLVLALLTGFDVMARILDLAPGGDRSTLEARLRAMFEAALT
jgi:AcrR family transcriptional regulator